jgi:hypothetical protein
VARASARACFFDNVTENKMKKIIANIFFCVISIMSYAQDQARLSWEMAEYMCHSTTPITDPVNGIAGYKVYYSKDEGRPDPSSEPSCVMNPSPCRDFEYQNVITVEGVDAKTATIVITEPGTYYFAVTSVKHDGKESCYSNEGTKIITDATPSKPTEFEIVLRK